MKNTAKAELELMADSMCPEGLSYCVYGDDASMYYEVVQSDNGRLIATYTGSQGYRTACYHMHDLAGTPNSDSYRIDDGPSTCEFKYGEG
jgi:hypothetical protein